MANLTLALDAMCGDNGPRIILPAALQALVSNPQLRLLLVGISEILNPLFADQRAELCGRLQIIPAEYAIVNDIKPLQAIMQSKGSSIRIALELVKSGQAQACILNVLQDASTYPAEDTNSKPLSRSCRAS